MILGCNDDNVLLKTESYYLNIVEFNIYRVTFNSGLVSGDITQLNKYINHHIILVGTQAVKY